MTTTITKSTCLLLNLFHVSKILDLRIMIKTEKKYSSGCGQISHSILKSHNEFSFAFQVSEVELCACVCVQKKSVILGLVLNWYFFCR